MGRRDRLARVSDRPYFMFRLNSPRPTFPGDMTADEARIMGAHADYWRALMPAGDVVLVGPVADPAGAWGLGVVRADDEAAARRLTENDPVVTSGFSTIDVFPMLSAIVRGE